jgi:hypothetical protein
MAGSVTGLRGEVSSSLDGPRLMFSVFFYWKFDHFLRPTNAGERISFCWFSLRLTVKAGGLGRSEHFSSTLNRRNLSIWIWAPVEHSRRITKSFFLCIVRQTGFLI